MNRSCNQIPLIIISALFLFYPLNLFPQTNNTLSVPKSDSTGIEASHHSMFSGLGYGSNMIYLGSTISQNQPYGYASMVYGFKDKLYAGVSAVHLKDRDPYFAFSIGSLSYNHTFNSWFDISAGISYYHIAQSLADTLFNSFLYGNLTLGFDWRLLYSKLTIGGMFSEETSPFILLSNSRYFQTPSFSSKNLFFSFDPYVNLIFGELTTVKTIDGTSVILSPPYGKGGKRRGQQPSTNEYFTKFSFLEIDFGVPVSLNSDRFTLEIEPGYVLPVNENKESQGTKGFVILISAFFQDILTLYP